LPQGRGNQRNPGDGLTAASLHVDGRGPDPVQFTPMKANGRWNPPRYTGGQALRCQGAQPSQPRKEFFFATPAEVRDVLVEKVRNLLEFNEYAEATEYLQSINLWPARPSFGPAAEAEPHDM
jgi:hypothetical protein